MRARPLPRLSLQSAEAADYVARSQPFVTEVRWPAHERWSREYLKDKCDPLLVRGTRRTATGNEDIEIDVREMIDLAYDPTSAGVYDFWEGVPQTRLWIKGAANPSLSALLDDVQFPALVGQDRLQSVTLWVRPGPYDNGNHYDPNGAENLNVQVIGSKVWQLCHPNLAGVMGVEPAVQSAQLPLVSWNCLPPEGASGRPGAETAEYFEATVGPGEAIYVPAFWMHRVQVPTQETTVNLNFWWTRREVPMTCAAMGWSFLNALLHVIRRREPSATLPRACEIIRGMTDETRSLLVELEQVMLSRPEIFNAAHGLLLRSMEPIELP
jgi:hypothetical protein